VTFSDFLNYFRDALKAFSKLPLNFSVDSPIHALGETVASIASKNDAAITNMEIRLSLLSATEEDLDNLMGNFGLVRKSASQAKGNVRIWSNTLPTTYTLIPSGMDLTDEDGFIYRTTEPAVIPSNLLHYPASIRDSIIPRYYAIPLKTNVTSYSDKNMSTEEIRDQFKNTLDIMTESSLQGLVYNIDKEKISDIRTNNLYVTNPNPFTGGMDLENDESFRSRGLSFIRGANSKFTDESLRSFILSQNGILDAKIIDDLICISSTAPPTGHIYAIINTKLLSYFDATAYASEPVSDTPSNIYQEIRNAIEDQGYRPAGIGITVKEADVLNVGFKSSGGNYLAVHVKADTIVSIKKSQLQAKIYNYFLSTKIGDNIYKADIIKLLKEDSDVVYIDDFTFLRITGVTSTGVDISTEVDFIECACNQVARIKGSEYVGIQVTTI
jgi:hypothetical protein